MVGVCGGEVAAAVVAEGLVVVAQVLDHHHLYLTLFLQIDL